MKTFSAICKTLFETIDSTTGIVEVNGLKMGNFYIDENFKPAFIPTTTFSFIYSENHGEAVAAFEYAMWWRLELGNSEKDMSIEITI